MSLLRAKEFPTRFLRATLRTAIAAQDLKIDRLTEQMGRATEIFIDSMGVIRTMQNNIETMQSEIRGLQVENRRILDRFFGEDNLD